MAQDATVLRTQLEIRLVVPGQPSLAVTAVLVYDASDPFAVSVTFGDTEDATRWTFSRELLGDGLMAPAGEGDVRVWPSRSARQRIVYLSLTSPTGRALFTLPAGEVSEFVRHSYAMVPLGEETVVVDIDAALESLLDEIR